MDFNSSLHGAHLLTSSKPLLWSWSKVNTFPQQASQAKNLTLEGTQGFHIIPTGRDSTIWFQQQVKASYRKPSFTATLPNNFILLLPNYRMALQLPKEPLHIIQLTIIGAPNKMEVPNPSPLSLLPQICYPCLFSLR